MKKVLVVKTMNSQIISIPSDEAHTPGYRALTASEILLYKMDKNLDSIKSWASGLGMLILILIAIQVFVGCAF